MRKLSRFWRHSQSQAGSFLLQSILVVSLLLLAFLLSKTDMQNFEVRDRISGSMEEQNATSMDDDGPVDWMDRDDDTDDFFDNDHIKEVDFYSRAEPVPEYEWSSLDNHTCLDQGTPEYPRPDDFMWRAPYALLIGAMKSGTSALYAYLQQHPLVLKLKRKEFHFYDYKFQFVYGQNGIMRQAARRRYRSYMKKMLEPERLERLKRNNKTVVVDDSPLYITLSDIVPSRVLCVTPWVKILAILRNPVDRAFSQFNMKRSMEEQEGSNLEVSFEDWVHKDIVHLRESGVIQNKIPREEFAGSEAEMEAWKTYTRLGSHAPIGRGLYAIQLRHWFSAFESFGKSRDDFFIVQSEVMRTNPELVFSKAVEFLELDPFFLQPNHTKIEGKYSHMVEAKTRKYLEEFYAPYNRELYDLLGDDWAGAWDPEERNQI